MHYLSNEKDKITHKLQIAIKLIESNGLLAQLQTQINQSILDSNACGANSASSASTRANRSHKQNLVENTSCLTQNNIEQQLNQSNNPSNVNQPTQINSQKIINIPQTIQAAPISSNRKSLTLSSSDYLSNVKNDINTGIVCLFIILLLLFNTLLI